MNRNVLSCSRSILAIGERMKGVLYPQVIHSDETERRKGTNVERTGILVVVTCVFKLALARLKAFNNTDALGRTERYNNATRTYITFKLARQLVLHTKSQQGERRM